MPWALPEGKDHQAHQVPLESKERRASLAFQDWTCPAPKETKALKGSLALQDSQGSLASLDSRGLLESQGTQVLKVKWASWEPRDNQAHQDQQAPQGYLERKGTTAFQAPQDPGATLALKVIKGTLGFPACQGRWNMWTWAA